MRSSKAKKALLASGALLIIVLAYLVPFLFGLLPPYDKEYLYIAAVGPMSGPDADAGQDMIDGITLALDRSNEQGGANGKEIRLLTFDDQDDEDFARAAALDIAEQDRVTLVLGHNFSSTSVQGGEIYKQFGIPAISASATAEAVTRDNPWYFRTVFSNSLQAAVLANYADAVLGHRKVSIIVDQRTFGASLAESFENEARRLGLAIAGTWQFDPREGDVEGRLTEIVGLLASVQDPGAIFLAVQFDEGKSLVQMMRDGGLTHQVLGANSIGDSAFADEFKELPKEKAQPGFYSDGIIATSPLIFDVANQLAQDFRFEYNRKFEKEPGWFAAAYYDAATIAVQALRDGGVAGLPDSSKADREKIRGYLAALSSSEQAVRGATGYIYFDENGDAIKSVPLGVFQKGRFISAPVQFQPVTDFQDNDALGQRLEDGSIVSVNGALMHKAMVVYTGIEISDIRDIDTRDSTFAMDFYLWFRSRSDFAGHGVKFGNSASELRLDNLVDEAINEEVKYRAYRVKGEFNGDFALNDYPFDQQSLDVRIHHDDLTRERLIFVRDDLGMEPRAAMLDDLRRREVLGGAVWGIKRVEIFQDTIRNESSLGHPELFDSHRATEFSRFNATIQIQRDILSYSVKNMTPVFLLVGLAYLLFFLPADQIAVRIGIGVNVILATAFFSVRLSNDLPNVGYLVVVEYIYIAVYVLALYGILAAIVGYVEAQRMSSGGSPWARRMVLAGEVGYPVAVIAGIAGLVLWKLG